MPSPPSSQTSNRSPHPILRWLGRSSPSPSRSSSSIRQNPPSTSSSRASSPLSALHDALNSSLPTPPPAVHAASQVTPTHPHRHAHTASAAHPPSLLRSITHTTSTLPPLLSSTSNPLSPGQSSFSTDVQPYPSYSPPQRSSLDTLRSLHTHSRTSTLSRSSDNSDSPPRSPRSDSKGFATTFGPSWWWFQGDNKENVDKLLDEADRADTIEGEQKAIRNKYLSPRHPIVFCHGLLGFDSVTIGPSIAPLEVTHWRGIKEVLEANGIEVLITRVPATSSPVDRAKVLERRIEEVYPSKAVHLVGHSMGGLDCRYLTTNLTEHTFTVLSVTTIATPHRGSSFADHFLSTLGPSRMPSFLSLLDMLPNGGGDGRAFECLTIAAMRKFNEETPDQEGVRYFSWGAVYEPGLIDTWKWPHSVILEKEGPNDGLVSIESSKWGTYLGTLTDVNHLDLVGWINTARYKWASLRGKEIQFKPATFYLGVADFLARSVEGLGPSKRRTGSGSDGGSQSSGSGDGKALGRQVAAEGSRRRNSVDDEDPWDARSEGSSSPIM